MAIIDPEGLFNGDRLCQCSDRARLYWVYFFAASNSYGRLEVNYRKLRSTFLANFNDPLTEPEFVEIIQEYHKNFLLFLYTFEGSLWGQWDTDSRFLPKYHSRKDKSSPQPPESEFADFKACYKNSKKFSEISENSESFSVLGYGIGIGVGVGVGVGIGVGEGSEPPQMNSIQKTIHAVSLRVLGVRAENWETAWDDIDVLVEAFGKTTVLDAFETWANDNRGVIRDRPVSAFNKVAPGLLSGALAPEMVDSPLNTLASTLYELGQQAFTGRDREFLGLLAKSYSAEDIITAYKEFIATKSESDMKYAAKNFCEGGALDVLSAIRGRREKDDRQSKALAAAAEVESKRAAEEYAALRASREEQSEEL